LNKPFFKKKAKALSPGEEALVYLEWDGPLLNMVAIEKFCPRRKLIPVVQYFASHFSVRAGQLELT
jgi:hypothetical protein